MINIKKVLGIVISFVKKFWFDILMIVGIIYFVEHRNWWGFWSIIFFEISIGLWKSWKKREYFMFLLRMAEVSLFGKTLDKGNWKKGELKERWKNTKIVWKRKEVKK